MQLEQIASYLNRDQRWQLRRLADAELRRRRDAGSDDLFRFVCRAPGYEPGWVHLDLCRRLEQFERDAREAMRKRRPGPRLVIAMPPRSGKTHIVSQRFPVWWLGRNPRHEIVCASYGDSLASSNSRKARQEVMNGIEGRDAFPHLVKFDEHGKKRKRSSLEVDQVNYWSTATGGTYQAVGVRGGLTGRGAHLLVIDDPIKDWTEANSPTIRESVWDWYSSVASTRLHPGAGVIVMATRWHEDDLTGRLLRKMSEGGEQWDVVSYAAIAEHDELLSPYVTEEELRALNGGTVQTNERGEVLFRRAGEALHPERYPLEIMTTVRDNMPARVWEALYQQRPMPAGGGLFKREWFQQRYPVAPWELAPSLDGILISVDATFRKGDHTDFVVLQVWGWKGPNRFLLDQVRARMNYPETKQALRDLRAKWHTAQIVLIETKANGDALVAELKDEFGGVIGYDPDKSKEARAQIGSVQFAAGNVYLPLAEFCPWVSDYIEEHVSFGAAAHDDQVDATSQALIYLRDRGNDAAANIRRQFAYLFERVGM